VAFTRNPVQKGTEAGKEPVLQVRGRVDAENGLALSAERSMALPLCGAAGSAFVLLAVFELLKIDLDPGITAWQSGAATIVFSGILAAGLALLVRREILKRTRAIERERDLFRRVIEGAPDGIFVKDMESRYVIVNRRFIEYKGAQSGAELLGKSVFDFLPKSLATVVAAEDQELRSGKSSSIEREISAVDGKGNVKWDSTTRVPLSDKDGRVVGVIGIQREITRSKLMEERLRDHEARLLAAQQIGHLGSFDLELLEGVDLEQCPMRCSDELARIAGFQAGDGDVPRASTNIFRLVAPENWDETKQAIVATVRDAKSYVLDFRIRCSDGAQRHVQCAGDVVRDSRSGKPLRLQGTILDVTDRRRAEEQLEEANANLAKRVQQLQRLSNELQLLSEMGAWLQSCNSMDEAYAAMSSSIERLFPDWVGGLYVISASRNVVEIVAGWGPPVRCDRVFAPEDCWALRRGQLNWFHGDKEAMHCRHADGAEVVESLCVPLMAHGEALGILHLQPSADPRRQLNPTGPRAEADRKLAAVLAEQIGLALGNLKLRETLRSQSIRDPLTGLFNRRYLEESLEREISRANRDRTSLAIIMLDIDHFKDFNDTYGHQAGDAALRTLGDFLKKATRGQDIVCRYGGEEFALVFSGSSLQGALERGEALRDGVKQLQVQYAGQLLGSITVSMGLSLFPDHGTTIADVVRGADQALYCAKRDGRDKMCVWTADSVA
jgi:diguanylate cyclase (GGDEF)-like protein/PAS domain S-box-containing protein